MPLYKKARNSDRDNHNNAWVRLCQCMLFYRSFYMPFYTSFYESICMLFWVSIYLPLCKPFCMSIYTSLCLSSTHHVILLVILRVLLHIIWSSHSLYNFMQLIHPVVWRGYWSLFMPEDNLEPAFVDILTPILASSMYRTLYSNNVAIAYYALFNPCISL